MITTTPLVFYKLASMKELYAFSRDCEDACDECPQYDSWNPIDLEDGRVCVSPVEVFDFWSNHRILQEGGYKKYLSDKAKGTFNAYVVRVSLELEGEKELVNTYTGEIILDVPRDVMVFN